jgi:UDPglucose 6-dehydrogenase
MTSPASDAVTRISVFGLGKLGAVVAGCHASRGFEVVGVDVAEDSVEKVRRGQPPVEEPGIEDLYAACGGRLTATLDGAKAVCDSDATLIIVPTPSEPDGSFSLRYALRTCEVIGRGLREKTDPHLVVMKSTVLPGACDAELIPALETASGKRVGVDFGFCYNPEFIALGSVIRNMLYPDFVLIGGSTPDAGDQVAAIYNRLLETNPPMARLSIVNAELAKLALNSYVTMKITFANLLARLCEQLPGGDVDSVTEALGLDTRIGPKYLKGGLGYGGPCFPRDNKALLSLAGTLDVPFPLAEATDSANYDLTVRAADLVASKVPPGGQVAVLGLSYKPDTAVIDESQGLLLSEMLAERGLQVTAYDPLAMEATRRVLGDQIKYAESASACIADADVVLIATPWREFRGIDYSRAARGSGQLVIDCWGLLDGDGGSAPNVLRLGRGG